MKSYTDYGFVIVDENGASIPKDEANTDYKNFLDLQAKGEVDLSIVAIEVPVVDKAELQAVQDISQKADTDQPVSASELRSWMAEVSKRLGMLPQK